MLFTADERPKSLHFTARCSIRIRTPQIKNIHRFIEKHHFRLAKTHARDIYRVGQWF